MAFKRRTHDTAVQPDMTPMIDMTFLLIAFFMVLMNFTEGEQDDRIKLPSSELAKPPDTPIETPLTLQLTRDGMVLFVGDRVPVSAMPQYLSREAQILKRQSKNPSEANVIIRADGDAQTGVVQQLIQYCQDSGFEKFKLRVKQEEARGT